MKKRYMKPEMKMDFMGMQQSIMAASTGVGTGDTPGDDYNPDDETYSKQNGSFWDDED